MTTTFVEKVRDDFPFFKRSYNGNPIIYLDNAATTQKPLCVLNKIRSLYENGFSNVHRALNFLAEEVTEEFEKSRRTTARFIGAKPNEVIFTPNATAALNLVSLSMADKGSTILTTTLEHHSNLIPWIEANQVCFVDWDSNGLLNLLDLKEKLRSKPKLVSIGWCSNLLGTIQPVKEIIALCKEAGALTLLDASQSLAHVPCNVRELDCDFLVFSGHKLYGPSGIGVLYGKQAQLETLSPVILGGSMVKEVSSTAHVLNDLPYRFEAGTPNIEGAIGLAEALKYITRLGYDAIASHENSLACHARSRMQELPGVNILSPTTHIDSAPLITFTVDGLEATGVAKVLSNRGNIIIRSGFHCAQPAHNALNQPPTCRASFAMYNTIEEIDRFVDVLDACSQSLNAC